MIKDYKNKKSHHAYQLLDRVANIMSYDNKTKQLKESFAHVQNPKNERETFHSVPKGIFRNTYRTASMDPF